MTLAWVNTPQRQFMLGSFIFTLCLFIALFTQFYYLIALPVVLVALLWIVRDVRILFLALMLSLPLSITLSNNLDFPDEPIMLAVTGVFVLMSILQTKKHHWKQWLSHPLMIIVLASFLWLMFSVLNSLDPALSVKFLLKKIWFLTPFLLMPLILFRDKKIIQKSAQLIFIPLTLLVILVLYKFSAYGFRFESVHAPMDPFFMNHVIYGSMISTFVPVIVAILLLLKRFSFKWLLTFGALLLFLVAVYLSYSRAALMAVVFAAGVFLMVRLKLMHYAILFFYAIVLSGVLLLSTNNTYLNFKPEFDRTVMHEKSFMEHVIATIQGTDISSAERYYRWIAGLRMSQDHPILGVGPNNFYDNYKNYTVNVFRTWVSRNPERSTTHNYFLFMLVEQGYPAMFLYGLLIFAVFFYGQRLYHRLKNREDKIIVMTAICLIGALFINNFFSELLESDKIGSLFYLAIAVIIVMDIKSKTADIIDNSIIESKSN